LIESLLGPTSGLPRVEPCSVPSSVAAVDMDTRAALRRLLLEGKVDAAMLKVQQEYPNIWKVCVLNSLNVRSLLIPCFT
jgi:predicted solute-binding protein